MNDEYINWINDRIHDLDPSGSYGRGIEYGLMLARDKYLDSEADKIINDNICTECDEVTTKGTDSAGRCRHCSPNWPPQEPTEPSWVK